MANVQVTFTSSGVSFNLTLTFAGAATGGTVTSISGTAGGQTVTGLVNYNSTTQTFDGAPYDTADDFSFAANGVSYNIYSPNPSASPNLLLTSNDGFFSNTATSNFVVTASSNTAPTLGVNAGLILSEGGTDTITNARLDFNDAQEADTAITYTVTSAATNGTLFKSGNALGLNGTFTQDDINNNRITYTHNGGETTSASFGFSVSDGAGGTVLNQTFSFSVTAVNDPPVLVTNIGRTLNEGGFTSISTPRLAATDAEQVAGALTYTVGTAPSNGTLLVGGNAVGTGGTFTQADIDNGEVSYQHNGSETTSDLFTFTVADGQGGSVGGTFNFTINAVNDAPTGSPTASLVNGSEDQPYTVSASDLLQGFSDPDSALSIANLQASNGSVQNNGDGTFTITPTQDFNGQVTLTYDVTDGLASLTNQQRSYTLAAANDPPTAVLLGTTAVDELAANDTVVGTLSATDVDGPGATFSIVADAGGRFKVVGNQVLVADGLLLDHEQNASHSITVRVVDGAGGSHDEIFTITVNDVGPETITGDGRANTFVAGAGSDTLDGGAGADTLAGGQDDDSYVVDDAGDVITEAVGGGDDTVRSSVAYTLTAGAEVETLRTTDDAGLDPLTLTGNAFAQSIFGNDGANILNGRGGADILQGLSGNDDYWLDRSDDQVLEAAGGGTLDRVFNSASFTLGDGQEVEWLATRGIAGTTAINLTGNNFAQSIFGNDGVNVLNGRGGADVLQGFGGDDDYWLESGGDQVIEAVGGGTFDRVFTSASFTLGAGQEVEWLATRGVADTTAINLTGNAFAQRIIGNNGVNVLDGNGGADILRGYGGNDDYYLDSTDDQVQDVVGGGTLDRVFTSASFTLAANQEIEWLATRSDTGTTAINLTGNTLAQTIYGNDGANVLIGFGGADELFGQGGNDRLYGGAGNDILNGGAGFDVFAFNTALDAATNVDTIQNYSVAQDVIWLDDAIFTGLALGTLAASAFTTGAAATDALDRIIYDAATGTLSFDADGDGAGAAIQFATIGTGLAMASTEFFVV